MKYIKMFGLAAIAAALMVFFAAGTASATILESSGGSQYLSGTSITAESEGTTELHPVIGSVNCKKSHIGAKTTNDGGAAVDVSSNVETFTLGECNAHITISLKGILKFIQRLVSSIGLEITIEYLGFHCVFKTNNTKVGTLTNGTPGTLDIESTIPRTGGKSGAFCGTTAQWTGSYKFTSPSSLFAT